jgi:hypothetical protein
MRTHVLAVLAALLLLLVLGAGTAAAGEPTQAVWQDASSQQSASSNANATQVNPTNSNVDVRIFSPGDGGDVTQTNAAGALAIAGNANQTSQSASQDQSGAGTQATGQDASNQQSADADADATQVKPSNENISVRIKSPGDDGDVTQTNAAGAAAAAGNTNGTSQSADQSQAGGDCKCHGGDGTQAVGQYADSKQSAEADADATQIKPSNSNISVRIGSPGNAGDVTQTNAALGAAVAGNANETTQSAGQSQGGGSGVQAVGQDASNHQSAKADADAVQYAPSNDNTSVRIGSAGDDGNVTQSNVAGALGIAGNANMLEQSAAQSQAGGDAKCGCGGTSVQAVGQFADSKQGAEADATAKQIAPSNANTPVRIGSAGGSGDVTQTNAAGAIGIAGNANLLEQSAEQAQGGGMDAKCGCKHGTGVQAVGQFADNKQYADADATAKQIKPSNTNAPVRIGSAGGSGSVTQTNAALAGAVAGNLNLTSQSAGQSQSGGGGVQAIGQDASNKQSADADATAFQLKPANTNAPVSIGHGGHGSKHKCGCGDAHAGGSGGDVTQTNLAAAAGVALNANLLDQSADQSQGGSHAKCGCYGKGGTQAIGQSAWNKQHADASANAWQLWAANDNTPVRIGSRGHSGNVTQTNAALAFGLAANLNALEQEAAQQQ